MFYLCVPIPSFSLVFAGRLDLLDTYLALPHVLCATFSPGPTHASTDVFELVSLVGITKYARMFKDVGVGTR